MVNKSHKKFTFMDILSKAINKKITPEGTGVITGAFYNAGLIVMRKPGVNTVVYYFRKAQQSNYPFLYGILSAGSKGHLASVMISP